MKQTSPEKLFVCLLKMRHDEDAEGIIVTISEEHGRYMADLWQKGIFWAGGPSADSTIAIEIYAVDSVEDAIKAQRNAPLYVKGVLYGDKYFEWRPKHLPP